jgi:hypothetical protein
VANRVPPTTKQGASGPEAPRPARPAGSASPAAPARPAPPAQPSWRALPTVPAAGPSTEAQLWSGVDVDKSMGLSMKDVEARLAEATAADGSKRAAARPDATSGAQRTLAARVLGGSSARPERPPDAFALLKDARAQGILFTEDAPADGRHEEQEDPALAEAVEACRRLCAGVKGVLRIGPGRNEQGEPVVVATAGPGFGEASLARVPAQVLGFATLVAIPFDLLPLRRER